MKKSQIASIVKFSYLGATLGALGYNIIDWRWLIVVVPIAIIDTIEKNYRDNNG